MTKPSGTSVPRARGSRESAERADTFTMVPHAVMPLVAAGKISPSAAWLYVILLGYVGQGRDDTNVWPSRRTLADAMGLGKTASVDRHLSELAGAGVLLIQRRRVEGRRDNDSNVYTLNIVRKGGSPQTGTTSGSGSPENGTTRSPQTGTTVVPDSGPELDPWNLDPFEEDPWSLSPDPPSEPSKPANAERARDTSRSSKPSKPSDPYREWRYEWRILIRSGLPAQYAEKVADAISELHDVNSVIGYLINAEKNDSLEDIVYEALHYIGVSTDLYKPQRAA